MCVCVTLSRACEVTSHEEVASERALFPNHTSRYLMRAVYAPVASQHGQCALGAQCLSTPGH